MPVTYAFNFPLTEVLCANASTLERSEIEEAVTCIGLPTTHNQVGNERAN